MPTLRGLIQVVVAAALAAQAPSAAQAIGVDLELVIAVDVSLSMDIEEEIIQRRGYVEAFRDPQVIDVIRSGYFGRIAVTYVEWAGFAHQVQVLPWRVLATNDDARAFADELWGAPITHASFTSISEGLTFAASLFEDNGIEGTRRVIDISGDGANNQGTPVLPARQEVVNQGIVINGLPIVIRPASAFDLFGPIGLEDFFQDCVIGGPGSFLLSIDKASEFAPTIRQKMVLEIAGLPPRIMLAQDTPPRERVDCLVGERSRGL